MADATITYLQNTGDGTNLSTYTFASQNFGTASADRHIICTVCGRSSDGGARTITSVTIGGTTAAENVDTTSSGNVCGIYIAAVPTGTSGNVVVVFNTTMGNADIALYSTTGVGSTTATDSGTSTSNPLTYALDVVAGGIAVAIATSDNGAATATWAGLTERFDDATTGGNDKSGASDAFATTQTNLTVSCTWTGSTRPLYAAASFPPVTASGPANLLKLSTNAKANISKVSTNPIANILKISTNA